MITEVNRPFQLFIIIETNISAIVTRTLDRCVPFAPCSNGVPQSLIQRIDNPAVIPNPLPKGDGGKSVENGIG